METHQSCCRSLNRMLSPGADEDQEQQHGGNAVVLKAGEEGGKKGLVPSELTQGELGQGELALGELAQSKPAQEALAQSGLIQEATGVVEEGEKEEEEMKGGHAGDGSSGPMDKGIHAEGGHGGSVQQQPQQEAAMPEGTKSLQAGDRQPSQRRTRFTQSQLQALERLFQETRYPTLRAR
ncbi:homeobox protein Rhox5-like [Peromyscus californicus insignis]|uniref:homeobox protein Rhox5-like n=1 Tax=Peromyscus californicus insignis TaxID=564181 RepID=UPI0022A7001F|nr:homeobox protein Rhox5-like [Peromyscus californicus insignis]